MSGAMEFLWSMRLTWLIHICEIILTHLLISLTGGLFHSLELELSGELILSLLQLLSAPHVLVVHVLDLSFDALELGIQLRGEKQRERERGVGEESCRPVQRTHWWTGRRHGNSTGGTGVWRRGQPIDTRQHGSAPSLPLISPPLSSFAPLSCYTVHALTAWTLNKQANPDFR